MAIGTRNYARPYLAYSGMPWGIKMLLIVNTVMFLAMFFLRSVLGGLFAHLALTPAAVVRSFEVWQLGTYLFLHASVLGFVFNMLALWWFGGELEGSWGTARFLRFYFLCGAGAGVCVIAATYAFGDPFAAILGSSGAIYGILAAFAALWPERVVLFIVFPMKMKYFVLLIAAIDFLLSLGGAGQMALLTGLLFGYFYVKSPRVRGYDPLGSLRDRYRDWKLQRAKRKFQVYLRKKGSDRDRWVN